MPHSRHDSPLVAGLPRVPKALGSLCCVLLAFFWGCSGETAPRDTPPPPAPTGQPAASAAPPTPAPAAADTGQGDSPSFLDGGDNPNSSFEELAGGGAAHWTAEVPGGPAGAGWVPRGDSARSGAGGMFLSLAPEAPEGASARLVSDPMKAGPADAVRFRGWMRSEGPASARPKVLVEALVGERWEALYSEARETDARPVELPVWTPRAGTSMAPTGTTQVRLVVEAPLRGPAGAGWSVDDVECGVTPEWFPKRGGPEAPVPEEERQMVEELLATGYLLGENPKPARTGVLVYQEGRACEGLNLYTSGHDTAAWLVDMRGNLLHSWHCSYERAWPGREFPDQGYGHLNWRRVMLLPDGCLLAVFEGVGLVKLDRNANIVWIYSGRAHHDLRVLENGDIYVLSRKARMVPRIFADRPVLEDFITLLDADGNVKSELSLLEAAERSAFWPMIRLLLPKSEGDLFHTNSLEWMDGSREHLSPLYRRGNILTSFKHQDAVAIVDMEQGKLVWFKSGPWVFQHNPILLENGNLLVYDNNRFCDYSRVLEYNPFTREIPWHYIADPPQAFFNKHCGAAFPLANGNILIIESEYGRAFEVTREREIVWEFVNPGSLEEKQDVVPYLYDLTRLPPDFPLDWLPAPPGEAGGSALP